MTKKAWPIDPLFRKQSQEPGKGYTTAQLADVAATSVLSYAKTSDDEYADRPIWLPGVGIVYHASSSGAAPELRVLPMQ